MKTDILIVGGGPAGLSAALYARRAEKRVLVLEKNSFGGQIAWSPRVENYPGIPAVSGSAFADALMAQALDLGAEADVAEVTGITPDHDRLRVRTDGGVHEARAVILATGAKHRRLGLPREEALTGSGVSYCAVCDGAFCAGQPVAVAGGGDAALQDAAALSAVCSAVYLIHRRQEFRAEAANVAAALGKPNVHPVLNARIAALEGEGELTGLTLEDTRDGSRSRLAVTGLFVAVGFEPENAPFGDVAELDAAGWFAAGEDCRTRTPGVFIAGDCRAKAVRQLATAVGDGAAAAVAACRYLDR